MILSRTIKLIAKVTLSVVAAALIVGGAYLGAIHYAGNFHTVVAGELYRSAQPTAALLEQHVREHGIRSVINLRGSSEFAPWYIEEKAATEKLGLHFASFRTPVDRAMNLSEFNDLVKILKKSPKPVLIHCRAGSDRSGLGAAVYLAAIKGENKNAAGQQLSILFGHFSIPYLSEGYVQARSWDAVKRWLGLNDELARSAHTPA